MFCVHTHSHIHIRSYVHVTYLLPHTGLYGEALQSVRRHENMYVCVCIWVYVYVLYMYIYVWMDGYTKKEEC